MNILIINAHSSLNKGDAGIIIAIIDSLKKYIPECNIIVKSRFPALDANAYDASVSECICNININEKTGKIFKLRYALKFVPILLGSNNRERTIDKDYDWADAVISCGGGFLLTHGFSVMTLQHLIQIKTAFNYNKPVIIYSQSIGPLYNKTILNLTRKVLNGITKIFVREKISYNLLQQIGVTSPVEIVPDAAFGMLSKETDTVNKVYNDIKTKFDGKSLVGITVRDWNFPEVSDPEVRRVTYKKSIAAVIELFTGKYNAVCILMPQVLGPNKFNDDRNISREILAELPDSSNAMLLDYDFHPRELKYLYSKMDMFIGTRMHSNIFALSSLIPTVAINYEHKTQGIMEMLDLKDYVLNISDITPDDLLKAAVDCWQNRDKLKLHLEHRIPKVIEQAQLPAQYLSELLVRQAQVG